MITRFLDYLKDLQDRQRMAIALAKGAATRSARGIDPRRPETWEFSGFSQNGEDGVLDFLRSKLRATNRYVVEVGASDGIQNNSAWLLVAEQYGGLLVEGDRRLAARAQRNSVAYSIGAECQAMFVTRESAPELARMALHLDPDVLSLDIDGNDRWIAESLFAAGFRPRILVVEFNSVFGPERAVTTPYRADFVYTRAHPTQLYYGVSIAGWRRFFDGHGYRFLTVERNGVNAFFVDPAWFDPAFLNGVQGLAFAENRYQQLKFRRPSREQYQLIADLPLIEI